MSSSLFFPLAFHATHLGAFFWLFPGLAALGGIGGTEQGRQTRAGMVRSGVHRPSGSGGMPTLLALVTLALAPLAGSTLTFFELWPLAVLAVIALLSRRGLGIGASIPIAFLSLGAILPAVALLVLGGSCHNGDLPTLGICARGLSGPIPSLVFLLALSGALSAWLGVAGAIERGTQEGVRVAGGSAGGRAGDALSGLAFYPLLLTTLLLGPGPLWWGATLILLGGALAVGGAVRGLEEARLGGLLATTGLAHHGIALMPLGAALMLRSEGEIAAAEQAAGASLLLLLCCALARCGLGIASATVGRAGSGHIGERGGLWRRMPRTGTTLLICGLGAGLAPPLGGFAAGWLGIHALLAAAGHAAPSGYCGLALLGAGALPLAGALLLIAWIRAFGATFLGPPQLDRPATSHAIAGSPTTTAIDVARGRGLAGPIGLLIAACVLLAGLIPGALLTGVRGALQEGRQGAGERAAGDWVRVQAQPIPGHPIPLPNGGATLIPLALLIAVSCLLLAIVGLLRLAGSRQPTSTGTSAYPARTYPVSRSPDMPRSSLAAFAMVMGWHGSGAGGRIEGVVDNGAAPWRAAGRLVKTRLGLAVRLVARASGGPRLPAAAWLLTIVAGLALVR